MDVLYLLGAGGNAKARNLEGTKRYYEDEDTLFLKRIYVAIGPFCNRSQIDPHCFVFLGSLFVCSFDS